MAADKVTIHSVGAYGPLGLGSLQIAMCARARRLSPHATRFTDKRGFTVGMCLAGALSEELYGTARLLALARPALREALHDARLPPIPLLLALPESGRPDDDASLESTFLGSLASAAGASIDLARSKVLRAGHAGGALAMEAAVAMLEAPGAPPAVLVGGADSYYHPDVLRWLDEECRLHSIEAENGFIPSEGAGFALVARADMQRADITLPAPIACVLGCASDAEATAKSEDEPNVARAMTGIVHRLLKVSPSGVGWVLSDLNGERHRIREWNFVSLRTRLADGVIQTRASDDLGDCGAASGPLFFAIAAASWSSGAAPSSNALVALHSEGVERGSVLMGSPS